MKRPSCSALCGVVFGSTIIPQTGSFTFVGLSPRIFSSIPPSDARLVEHVPRQRWSGPSDVGSKRSHDPYGRATSWIPLLLRTRPAWAVARPIPRTLDHSAGRCARAKSALSLTDARLAASIGGQATPQTLSPNMVSNRRSGQASLIFWPATKKSVTPQTQPPRAP